MKRNEALCAKCHTPLSCASCRGKKGAKALSKQVTSEQRRAWGKLGGRGKKKSDFCEVHGEHASICVQLNQNCAAARAVRLKAQQLEGS